VAASITPVTVAITTLDRPDALARCLRSLAAGSATPAEVVVVDQSRERTARPVVESADGLPEVRYLHDDGVGLGRGQNIAVRAARHPTVAVLDDDCVAGSGWVSGVGDRLDDADLVGGRVLPLADSRADVVPVSSRTSERPVAFNERTVPWAIGSGNNFALQRDWFERVGGCDERLGPGAPGLGGLDMDLFYRLVRAGASARYDPELIVYHEQKSPEERLARRVPYGFGMAAACVLWRIEGGDRFAGRVFVAWLRLRVAALARAALRGRWRAAHEEVLVLVGTGRGVLYGLRVARRHRD